MRIPLFIALSFLLSGMASAQHAGHGAPSAYAGEEARAIKSLSDADIAELRRGGGWGLAKAAELNGMPGPAHLLELKDEIDLSPEQVGYIERVFQEMQQAAIEEGERLISGEQALEDAFRSRQVDEGNLQILLNAIEESRTHLRFIHLRAHLKVPDILTDQQIARYNTLRGYAADPCKQVPAGHDPVMWRKHNGCE
jgi:Spy/CpxP family protein refolding chaperone